LLRETTCQESRYERVGSVVFRALQAEQWSLGSETTIDGPIAQLLQAFEELEPRMIDCGFFTTLQACSNDMMEVIRWNDYIIQHLKCFRLLQDSNLVGRLIVIFLRYKAAQMI
jgi:hypothetical protein